MKDRFTIRGFTVPALAVLCCIASFAWGQDSGEPGASLGDLARQTRTRHATAEAKPSKAQDLVDEMQQEQEASENAPFGFKNYNAGDYRLFVPFPFSLEGRIDGGAVLLGSRVGITNTEVVAGTPIPIPANLSDNDLLNAARQYASRYGAQAYCSPTKRGEHKAFRCAWSGNPFLLGHVVWGSMEIIVAPNSLVPVMCVSPDDMHTCYVYDNWGHNTCTDANSRKTHAAIQAGIQEEQTTFQMCDQVIYPSIQLKEDIVVHPATIADSAAARVAPTAAGIPAQNAPPVVAGSQTSLAELARRTRQATQGHSQSTFNNAEGISGTPAGFQTFVLQYCQNPQHCAEAAVVIPENAEVVSRTNGQHIFKAVLDGDPVMLYAGPADVNAPYRSLTDPDFIRMRDLGNANGWSHEKTDAVSTQELTIEGKYSLMTRFRYQRDQKKWWIGERVVIGGAGSQFLLGCTAPEEHFADAEALCTTLVNSLRLP